MLRNMLQPLSLRHTSPPRLSVTEKVKQEAFEKCWAHLPLRAAVTVPFTRCRYCRTPAIAIAQAAFDVHDNDDNDNDNA